MRLTGQIKLFLENIENLSILLKNYSQYPKPNTRERNFKERNNKGTNLMRGEINIFSYTG